jgi:enoyl-CoA hydratase/carnithine racemase
MTEFGTLLVEKRDKIGIVTLNRPEKFNTFNTQMATELNNALTQLDRDPQIRAVMIKGAGKVFSTGIDLGEFGGKSQEEYRDWIDLMDRMHITIAEMGKPVIAVVHGYAVANGAGLLAAADFAIVAEGTRIGTTAINVGLLCTGPLSALSYSLGKKKALEMLLGGEMIDAKEAERLGLVNRVVPRERLEAEAFELAGKLVEKSPIALAAGKRFYYRAIDLPFRERLALNSEVVARLCMTEDAKEGVDAFRNKRVPTWKGE